MHRNGTKYKYKDAVLIRSANRRSLYNIIDLFWSGGLKPIRLYSQQWYGRSDRHMHLAYTNGLYFVQ